MIKPQSSRSIAGGSHWVASERFTLDQQRGRPFGGGIHGCGESGGTRPDDRDVELAFWFLHSPESPGDLVVRRVHEMGAEVRGHVKEQHREPSRCAPRGGPAH